MSAGSRIAAPAEGTKVCASCGEPRGTRTKGWEPVTRAGVVVGFTCPTCPRADEPIRLEASGRFVAVVGVRTEGGKRRQLKRRFPVLEDAREWVQEVREGSAKTLAYDDPRKLTVRALAARWLARREQEVGTPGGIRTCTVNGYRSALTSLLDLIGNRPVREVTPDDVEAALRTLATVGGRWGRPLTHRSLTYSLGALRQVFAYGKRAGLLKSNPALEAKAPGDTHAGTKAAAPKRWTTGQLVAFRTHVDGLPLESEPWLKAGMRLTLCGLRRSEVLGLDWSNVDLKTGAVTIAASRTKDGRGSTSSLNAPKTEASRRTVEAEIIHLGTLSALRALWLAQGRPEAGLVICDAAGVPVQPDAYSRRFVVLCKAAGVPVLTRIHNTRHTLATALKEAGVPDNQAAALLGHDVQTYQRFYLVVDDEGAAAAATMAGKLFAAV